jgi:hypothetical protein
MQTEVQNIVCPHCGVVVSQIVRHNGFQAGGTSIGPSAIRCPGCGSWVGTGTSEWDEKGFFQKSWFLLTRLLWFVVGSVVVAGFLGAMIGWAAVEARVVGPGLRIHCTLAAYIVISLLIAWIMARNTLREIRDSRRRVAEAKATPDTEPETIAEE